ncbi:hypothetical protein ACA910_004162 [Epithemia clementina (nom. ined.)]
MKLRLCPTESGNSNNDGNIATRLYPGCGSPSKQHLPTEEHAVGTKSEQSHHRRFHTKQSTSVGDEDANFNRHHRNNGTTVIQQTSSLSLMTREDDESAKKHRKRKIVYWTKDVILSRVVLCIGVFLFVWSIILAFKRLIRFFKGEQLPPDSTLDFLVAGFPKSGTTTLLAALHKHPEIAMGSEENCQIARPIQQDDVNLKRLNRYLDALKKNFLNEKTTQQISSTDSRPNSQFSPSKLRSPLKLISPSTDENIKLGIKCPDSVKNFKAIHRLSQHSPDCKFVIGVRHPILFLQSFYNYRVFEAHLKKDKLKEGIPSLFEIWDEHKNWCDVSPDAPRYELFLSQFGKTDLTVEQMRDWYLDRPMLAVKPNRFHIFLYSLEQLEDRTQSTRLRRDLQVFLELKNEILDFGHENKIGTNKQYNGSIDICKPEFDPIRASVLDHAKATVQWVHSFLDSPDVYVSNRPYLQRSINNWTMDPCIHPKM